MLFRVLFSLALLASLTLTSASHSAYILKPPAAHRLSLVESGICPALSYFLGIDNKGTKTPTVNNSSYCSMVQHTGCTISDFAELKQWWENPVTYSNAKVTANKPSPRSRWQIRQRKLEDIASYTWEMLKLSKEVKKRARLIIMSDKADARCSKAAEKFLMFKFHEDNFKDYLKNAENCWRFTNDIQTKILCNVCDPKAQKNLDLKKGFIYFNNTSKAMLETACLDMLRMNVNNIFPYLELLEPIVRCTLDGKMSTKDKLRLRRSDRIWGNLEDGLSEENLHLSLSFGEELNLNSEGDARFVTFLFRNLKEFVEMRVEGQIEIQPQFRQMSEAESVTEDSNSKAESKSSEDESEKDRQLIKNSRRRILTQDNFHLLGKRFEKLDKKKSITSERFIDALDTRILYLTRTKKKNAAQIGEFVSFVKQRFHPKVKDVNIMELPISSDAENSEQSFGKFARKGRVLYDRNSLDAAGNPIARNFFAEETNINLDQEKSTDQVRENVSRQLRGIDTFMSNVNEESMKTEDYMNHRSTDKPLVGRKLSIQGGDHSHTKADALNLSPNTIYNKMTEENPTLKSAYPKMPADFDDTRKVENGLREMRGLGKDAEAGSEEGDQETSEKIEENPARRLEEKKDEMTDKSKLQIAISIVKQNIIDEYNNGDIESLKLAYPKDKFLETIKKKIRCLDVEKTNKKTNRIHLQFLKDDKCLDFEQAKYTKMMELWDDKIKFPQVPSEYSKDTDFEDIIVDDVTSHLDEAKDNLNKKCEYKKKKAEKTLRMMRGRRLQVNDMKEIPKDKNWDSSNDDPLTFKKRKLAKGENTEGEVAADDEKTDDDKKAVAADEKTDDDKKVVAADEKQRGMSLGDIFHHEVGGNSASMEEETPKLTKAARPQVIRDNLVFLLDADLKYDFLTGIGKTGFKKIDFREQSVLNGMAVYKRLDDSIKLHTNWNPSMRAAAGVIGFMGWLTMGMFLISM